MMLNFLCLLALIIYDRGGSRGRVMWFIGVEEEQETSAPPPKTNPGSAPARIRAKR